MHPGEFLREVVLPATGVPKTRVAAMLGLSRQSLYDILNERAAVRAVTALRL
jgi:plasmid maintenance system antidote protein VapI